MMRAIFSFKKDVCLMLLALALAVIPDLAFAAQPENMVVEVLCRVINELTGNIGKVISIIVLISLAIMLFLGKVSWGVAIAFAVAIGILFGATSLVTLFAGGGDPCAGIT